MAHLDSNNEEATSERVNAIRENLLNDGRYTSLFDWTKYKLGLHGDLNDDKRMLIVRILDTALRDIAKQDLCVESLSREAQPILSGDFDKRLKASINRQTYLAAESDVLKEKNLG